MLTLTLTLGKLIQSILKCSVLLQFLTMEWVSLLPDILNMKFPYFQMSIDLLYFQKVNQTVWNYSVKILNLTLT